MQRHWPSVEILAKCTRNTHAFEEIVKSKCDLLFLGISQFIGNDPGIEKISMWVPQTILMESTYEHAAEVINCGAAGYLLKPLEETSVKRTFMVEHTNR